MPPSSSPRPPPPPPQEGAEGYRSMNCATFDMTRAQLKSSLREKAPTMPANSRVFFDFQIAQCRAHTLLDSLPGCGEDPIWTDDSNLELGFYCDMLFHWPRTFGSDEERDDYFEIVEQKRLSLVRVPMCKNQYLAALQEAKARHNNRSVRGDWLEGTRLARSIISRIPGDLETVLDLNDGSPVSHFLNLVLECPRVFHGYTFPLTVKEQRYFSVMDKAYKAAKLPLDTVGILVYQTVPVPLTMPAAMPPPDTHNPARQRWGGVQPRNTRNHARRRNTPVPRTQITSGDSSNQARQAPSFEQSTSPGMNVNASEFVPGRNLHGDGCE